ncbi:hypothetical protein DSL92_05505 [Billgrantia gudaonensis]|uniref:Uncharacterized protein n=1 Tax=Billgrantia gudaonensis TaxID=376427 RepID=A0A3S0Q171_9GAMM|nr:hypothetical protein DSL92_05505 [Halomonas gudaonensis]
MSPGGAVWLLLATGLAFLVLYLQQAGMILVAVRRRDNHFQLAFVALWQTLHRLPALIGLVVAGRRPPAPAAPAGIRPGLALRVFLGGFDLLRPERAASGVLAVPGVALPLTLLWAVVAGHPTFAGSSHCPSSR